MALNKEAFLKELESYSEDHIHELLAMRRLNDEKAAFAREFLRRKNQERSEALGSEQMEIARSAKDAAWEAASAARKAADEAREQSRIASSANTRATIALVLAAIMAAANVILAYLAWAGG